MTKENVNKIRNIIYENYKINKKEIEKLLDLFKYYKKSEIIYLQAIKRKTNLDENIIIDILLTLSEEHVIQKLYDIDCPYCNHSIGYFRKHKDIPLFAYCKYCDIEVENPKKYGKLVYKYLCD